jgi:hypothetical protein
MVGLMPFERNHCLKRLLSLMSASIGDPARFLKWLVGSFLNDHCVWEQHLLEELGLPWPPGCIICQPQSLEPSLFGTSGRMSS